jgi:methionyl-tRNA synthetase
MTITYDDFAKMDIRIGTITAAEKIEGADKLLKLNVDLGTETRQLVAGIAQVFPEPSVLINKQIPVLCNLEPRTLRGIESQGMMLAADENGMPILLHPEHIIPNGSQVR